MKEEVKLINSLKCAKLLNNGQSLKVLTKIAFEDISEKNKVFPNAYRLFDNSGNEFDVWSYTSRLIK